MQECAPRVSPVQECVRGKEERVHLPTIWLNMYMNMHIIRRLISPNTNDYKKLSKQSHSTHQRFRESKLDKSIYTNQGMHCPPKA